MNGTTVEPLEGRLLFADGTPRAILVVSLVFTWRFKNKEPVLVLLAGIVGILLKGV